MIITDELKELIINKFEVIYVNWSSNKICKLLNIRPYYFPKIKIVDYFFNGKDKLVAHTKYLSGGVYIDTGYPLVFELIKNYLGEYVIIGYGRTCALIKFSKSDQLRIHKFICLEEINQD